MFVIYILFFIVFYVSSAKQIFTVNVVWLCLMTINIRPVSKGMEWIRCLRCLRHFTGSSMLIRIKLRIERVKSDRLLIIFWDIICDVQWCRMTSKWKYVLFSEMSPTMLIFSVGQLFKIIIIICDWWREPFAALELGSSWGWVRQRTQMNICNVMKLPFRRIICLEMCWIKHFTSKIKLLNL